MQAHALAHTHTCAQMHTHTHTHMVAAEEERRLAAEAEAAARAAEEERKRECVCVRCAQDQKVYARLGILDFLGGGVRSSLFHVCLGSFFLSLLVFWHSPSPELASNEFQVNVQLSFKWCFVLVSI